jgi:hypothetical protein
MKTLFAACAAAVLLLVAAAPASAQDGTTTTTTTTTTTGPGGDWTTERSYTTSTQGFDWDNDRRERFRTSVADESRAYDEGFRTYETDISRYLTPAQRDRWNDLVTSDTRYVTIYSTPAQRAQYEAYMVQELGLNDQQRAQVIPIWRRAVMENEGLSSRYQTEQETIVRHEEVQTFHTTLANNSAQRWTVARTAPTRTTTVDTANVQQWDRDHDLK